jgi:hypothetical protein
MTTKSDAGEKIFGIIATNSPKPSAWIELNGLFRAAGITSPADIRRGLTYVSEKEWADIRPTSIQMKVNSEKATASQGRTLRSIAPVVDQWTLDNQVYKAFLTEPGRMEIARREREIHEAEYIAKQNTNFDEVMALARDTASAAKASAAAAEISAEQSVKANNGSKKTASIAVVAAVVSILAWLFPRSESETKVIVVPTQYRVVGTRNAASASIPNPTAPEVVDTSVIALCGPCPKKE